MERSIYLRSFLPHGGTAQAVPFQSGELLRALERWLGDPQMEATMHEAKSNLSRLVARALAGEEVILTHGKKRTPAVKLVPVAANRHRERPIGLYKGQVDIGPEFFEPLPEAELRRWEGDAAKPRRRKRT
jgi:antitoxin (DNA-binding transcriptional repressor) of toxin-antitoxin stability system